MALEAGGRKYCKFNHTENGKTFGRRIHIMNIQSADGRLHVLQGADLPDEVSTYAGVAFRGAHVADVFLSPKSAKGSPILPAAEGWLSKRDAFFLVLGFFLFNVIRFLAEESALALM